ncbi:MAG: hypothetical protein IKD04_03215 [Clostridia bacterium]|nr:hypothetical protein [Clostridia bacterium]
MGKTDEILKRAFIDAQIDRLDCPPHRFSAEFEQKMQRLIRSQKGVLKLVNTVYKRVACVALAVIICLATTVFSVEALREPFMEAVEQVLVAVKERLKGTRADNIAEYFTDDITQIVATNCITSVPKEYVIASPQKISEFITLLSQTYWGEPLDKLESTEQYVNYRFEFKSDNKTVTVINMCGCFGGLYGTAEIVTDSHSMFFNISERTYLDILSFTTQKYYLHKSDLEMPGKERCLAWQTGALEGLTGKEKESLCKTFRALHNHIEEFLLGRVSILKEPDSIYWGIFELERDEVFVDPITGSQGIDNTYHIINDCFDSLIETAKAEKLKSAIAIMKADFERAIKGRDIGSVFTVHEVIHDYDYYAVNYPVYYELQAPDWGGIDEYFGHLENAYN